MAAPSRGRPWPPSRSRKCEISRPTLPGKSPLSRSPVLPRMRYLVDFAGRKSRSQRIPDRAAEVHSPKWSSAIPGMRYHARRGCAPPGHREGSDSPGAAFPTERGTAAIQVPQRRGMALPLSTVAATIEYVRKILRVTTRDAHRRGPRPGPSSTLLEMCQIRAAPRRPRRPARHRSRPVGCVRSPGTGHDARRLAMGRVRTAGRPYLPVVTRRLHGRQPWSMGSTWPPCASTTKRTAGAPHLAGTSLDPFWMFPLRGDVASAARCQYRRPRRGGVHAWCNRGSQMFEQHRVAAASESEPTLPEYVAVLIVLGVFVATVLSLVGIVSL